MSLKSRIRSIESKIMPIERKDKENVKKTGDCTMAAFRCNDLISVCGRMYLFI